MAELVLSGVSKRFGRTQAVSELSLTVADGELVVLLGPTGAGKTTTLRLAAGLETADAGRVEIDGQDHTASEPAARDVAFVFQQFSLYPHYTVYDNLAFPLRAPGRRTNTTAAELDGRVREVATLLGIDSKLRNRATALSGGEMQRVAIGRALVRRPSVFLLDEPLSSLDAKLREQLRLELKRIQSDLGATMLYVTHDQTEALTLADRIGVLAEGRLVQVGTPREVYARPASVYVARRLGSPPMNLLPPAVARQLYLHPPDAAAEVGVRPEDLLLDTAPNAAGPQARLLQVERLGAETVLLLALGERQLHALAAPGERYQRGQQVALAARPETALYFTAEQTLMET